MFLIKNLLRTLVSTLAATGFIAKLAQAEMTAQFLGNTTIAFDDGQDVIMIDGFLSRHSLPKFLAGVKVTTDTKVVDDILDEAKIDKASAVFVAHAHFDHALDAGYVSRKLGARVYGSRSTRAVARAYRHPDDGKLPPLIEPIHILQDEQTYVIGNFQVTAIYTPHGGRNLFPGETRPGFVLPAKMNTLRANENYSFLIQNGASSALVVPGGNYLPGKLDKYQADTVFLGIGGLRLAAVQASKRGNKDFINIYWRESVNSVGASTIVPVHWDNFFVRLDPQKELKALFGNRENFPNVQDDLEGIVRRNNAPLYQASSGAPVKDGKVCLVWMKKPFTTLPMNGGPHCETGKSVAVLPTPGSD